MKNITVIVFKIIFIIFTIILLPISYLWGFTHEQIIFVNNNNIDEIKSILDLSEIDDSNKEIEKIISNNRWDYYAVTIYYSDGSEKKDIISLEYKEFEEFISNNAISGFVIVIIIDLIFVGISILIVINTIFIKPLKKYIKKQKNKPKTKIGDFSNINIVIMEQNKQIYKGDINFISKELKETKFNKFEYKNNEIIFYI